jgi:hypothetical protein
MTRYFNDFVKAAAESKPVLPLVHTSDAFYLDSILQQSQLATTECDVFTGEHLLYFFYGRPAYRTMCGNAVRKLRSQAPICLLIGAEHVSSIRRVAPFDTGAFATRFFEEYFHPAMTKEDFLVDPTIEMAGRIVGRFFGTNERYFLSRPTDPLEVLPWDHYSSSYAAMIRDESRGRGDDRRATVEIQTDQPVPLGPGVVKAVVLPVDLLDGPILQAITALKAFPITYEFISGSEHHGVIVEKVKDYLRSERLL